MTFRRRFACLVGALAIGVSGVACSVEFTIGGEALEDAAVDLIEGALGEQLGLTLDATCPAVEDPEVGTSFTCTAVTADGRTVFVDGLVDRADHIDLSTRNAVRTDSIARIEDLIIRSIADQTGEAYEVDCGSETIVAANDQFTCGLAQNGSPLSTVVVTVTDWVNLALDYTVEPY